MRNINVGEHLGGSRRDYRGGRGIALTREEIERLSPEEASLYVKKANLWPPVSWQQLHDSGMTPQGAALIKLLRDSITGEPPVTIDRNGRPHLEKESALSYAETVTAFRDALSKSGMKETRDVLAALTEPMSRLTGGHLSKSRAWNGKDDIIYTFGNTKKFSAAGQRFSRLISEIYHEAICRTLDEAWRRREVLLPLQPPECMPDFVRLKVQRMTFGAEEGDDCVTEECWSLLLRPKKRNTEGKAAALKKQYQAEGARRDPARNVSAKELMDEFALRGVQFGQSMPDQERQEHINQAYDAFDQLSAALDIPRKAIGFNGKLGLAFGARGRSRASAHYETSRQVINLTRHKGAGTLAHEWMHAYDDIAGGSVCLSTQFASVLTSADATADDLAWWGDTQIQKALDTVEWVLSLVSQNSDGEKVQTESRKLFAAAEQSLDVLKASVPMRYESLSCVSDEAIQAAASVLRPVANALRAFETNIRTEFPQARKVCNAACRVLARGLWHKAAAQALQTSGRAHEHIGQGRETEFFRTAKVNDKKFFGSKGYLTNSEELFARAGSAYIYDKLSEKGMSNIYLVSKYESPDRDDAEGISNNVPYGWERRRINGAFDKSFAEYRSMMKALECEPIVESASRSEEKTSEETLPPLKMPESQISSVEKEESFDDVLARIRTAGERDAETVEPRLGGMFSTPLILGVKDSARFPNRLLLMLFDDSDLAFGGRIEYQLAEAERFGESVEGARLIVPGPLVSARGLIDGQEICVDESDAEKTDVFSDEELKNVLEHAKQLGFTPTLEQDAVEKVCSALAERADAIAENKRRHQTAEEVQRRQKPGRRVR